MRRGIPALAALLLAAALTVTGCGAGDNDAGSDSAKSGERAQSSDGGGAAQKEAAGPDAAAPGTAPSSAAQGGRLKLAPTALIRTAEVTVRAKDVAGTVAEARTAVETAGGYVSNESVNTRRGSEHAVVTLKVPADMYDTTLADVAELGDKLLSRDVKVQDVTDQVVDVDSRVKSARASVDRIRKLMDEATRISDVVALEGELSTREANLEALLAQQASLKDRTSLGTITLEVLEPDQAPKPKDDDDPTILSALSGGWDAFVGTLRWIGIVLAAAAPFAAVAVVLWFAVRTLRRRLPDRAPAPPALSPPVPWVSGPPPAPGGDEKE
ncbi:DUF4349 domain-containing protein [Streptomyces sp. NPDC051940]|uniref:DUF4349 domain-containing protein n=1 Tax=Streptomyces sp. NPDC051940 TaxID=3155675 RepID=UPI00342327F5